MRSLWPCLWGVLQNWSLLVVSTVAQPRFVWQEWHFVRSQQVSSHVKRFCVTGAILLRGFQKMACIFPGRRSTLETSIVILRGRRSTLDACCCVFLRLALSGLRQVVTTCKLRGRCGTSWGFTLHFALHTPHSTLYTPRSTLYTLHFTLHTLHLTFHNLHSKLYTLHSTLDTSHSTLYTLHITLHALHLTLRTPHFTVYTPHSTLYTLHFSRLTSNFALDTLHSTLYTPHFTLYTPHSTLYTPHTALYTPHFTLYTRYFTLHNPRFTPYTLFPTQHPVVFTLQTLTALHYIPHSTVYTGTGNRGRMMTNVQDCWNNLFHESVLRDCISLCFDICTINNVWAFGFVGRILLFDPHVQNTRIVLVAPTSPKGSSDSSAYSPWTSQVHPSSDFRLLTTFQVAFCFYSDNHPGVFENGADPPIWCSFFIGDKNHVLNHQPSTLGFPCFSNIFRHQRHPLSPAPSGPQTANDSVKLADFGWANLLQEAEARRPFGGGIPHWGIIWWYS